MCGVHVIDDASPQQYECFGAVLLATDMVIERIRCEKLCLQILGNNTDVNAIDHV